MKKKIGALIGVLGLSAGGFAAFATTAPVASAAADVQVSQSWNVSLGSAGGWQSWSSPALANLDGQPDAVVGSPDGQVFAFDLANGTEVPGWPVNAGAGVLASPSVSNGSTVFVGTGTVAAPQSGSVNAYGAHGNQLWGYTMPTSASQGGMRAVIGGVTVDGGQEITASLNHTVQIIGGGGQSGPSWNNKDTIFDVPAVGQGKVFIGSDQTTGSSHSGYINALSDQAGFQCQYHSTQSIQSSGAAGNFLPGGTLGYVTGTSTEVPGASDTNKLLAIDGSCHLQWSFTMGGANGKSGAAGGPALGNMLGGSDLYIADGADNGQVVVLNGSGQTVWNVNVGSGIIGGVVTADLTGQGYDDVIAPTGSGATILDGKTGATVATLSGPQMFSSPLVAINAAGQTTITLVGLQGGTLGATQYVVSGGTGNLGAYAWPEFHANPQLTGFIGGSGGGAVTPPPSCGVGDSTGRSTIADGSNVHYQAGATIVQSDPAGKTQFELGNDGVLRALVCGQVEWASPSAGAGAWLTIQSDGNLVLYSASDSPRWASNTRFPAATGGWLTAQADGNVVLYSNTTGKSVWATGTAQ